jgi:hypothetical protein
MWTRVVARLLIVGIFLYGGLVLCTRFVSEPNTLISFIDHAHSIVSFDRLCVCVCVCFCVFCRTNTTSE